jgi:dTDP-L-rhamnose 4-epimerase
MRVLVTGGAGFVGSHIVELLVADGHEVVVLDSVSPALHPVPPQLPDGVELVRADVRDADAWRVAARGVDAVCHQAARVGLGVDFADVSDYVADNDAGTAAGLRALHDLSFAGRIVLASSMVVYGAGRACCLAQRDHASVTPPPRTAADLQGGRFEPRCGVCGAATRWLAVDESTPLAPQNVYAATKVHQEHLCGAFGRAHDVPVTALRYHNVYGARMPRDTPYAGVASLFRSAVERGEAPRVLEDGGQVRDFVHVRDVARANLLAMTALVAHDGPLNIASGHPRRVLDLANAICDGTPVQPSVVGGGRVGDVRHIVASPALAARAIGFRASCHPDVGLRAFRDEPLRPAAGEP